MDSESQSFQFLLIKASDTVYDLGSSIRKIERLIAKVNPPLLATEMTKLSSLSSEAIKKVNLLSEVDPPNASSHNKSQELNDQLNRLLAKVKTLQTTVANKLKSIQKQEQSTTEGIASTPHIDESSPLFGNQQSQVQVYSEPLDQQDLDLHTILIDDREGNIAEIQRGTQEINSIFRDLGVLIREQGQQIDSIEDNIVVLAQQTNNGGNQLNRAYNYQKSRGKWTCILLLVLLVITILVSLIVIS